MATIEHSQDWGSSYARATRTRARRLVVGAASVVVMALCVAGGWGAGASPVFALAFMPAGLVFAVCWWSLVTEDRR